MNFRHYVVAVTAALALTIPSQASAQGRGHGRGHAKTPEDRAADSARHDGAKRDEHHAIVIDRDAHVRVMHEYAHHGSLPPGLAKHEALPPGLRQQLHENGALPPGLQKRLVPVPVVLVRQLPPVPSYYHRYFAGDDMLVVDGRTHRIVAIIPNVWS